MNWFVLTRARDRFRFWWHHRCGGVLPQSFPDGRIEWRCWCGVVLGHTDLRVTPKNHHQHGAT